MIKKIFIIFLFIGVFVYSQNTKMDYTSKADEGWYFANHFIGKWNYFGAAYQGQLFYKKSLFREKNSFWFADSYLSLGLEAELSTYARTTVYAEFQPLIALNFAVKFTYEGALANTAKPVLVDKAGGNYSQALPPFTGLNPQTVKPIYQGGNNFMFQFIPTLTIGGPVANGMIALIYSPTITFIHAFGVENGSYHYYVKDNIVMKNNDFWFVHDIKLGYNITSLGMSFAVIADIEHIASYNKLWRVGIFAGYTYKKQVKNIESLTPFVNVKLGTWLVDKYLQYKFAAFIDTGLTWKFK